MKGLLITLCFTLAFPVWAARSITVKGKLESYNTTHFKLKQGKKVWKLPLSVMDEADKFEIEKKLGKEITVNVPHNIVTQGK